MANAARPAAGLRTCTGRSTRNRAPSMSMDGVGLGFPP
jgi:hypothetical protein